MKNKEPIDAFSEKEARDTAEEYISAQEKVSDYLFQELGYTVIPGDPIDFLINLHRNERIH